MVAARPDDASSSIEMQSNRKVPVMHLPSAELHWMDFHNEVSCFSPRSMPPKYSIYLVAVVQRPPNGGHDSAALIAGGAGTGAVVT